MTRVEREKRIKELETRLFFLNMVDRPTYEDYKMMTEVENEIRRLKGIAQTERKDKDNKRVARLFFSSSSMTDVQSVYHGAIINTLKKQNKI